MKITIVNGPFLPVPPLLGGAVEKMWLVLSKIFAERGHFVTQISRQYPTLPSEETLSGVRHIRIKGYDAPQSIIRSKLRDFFYSRRVKAILPASDILITNTFWLPMLNLSPSCGKLCISVGRMPKGQMRFYKRAARVYAPTKAVKDAILKESSASPVKVIPHPLPEPYPLFHKRKKIILYAGRIHPEKGLPILLKAFSELFHQRVLKDWNVTLAGPWEIAHGGGGTKYFQKLKKNFPLPSSAITWTGPIFEMTELHQLYQNATLFVYPSLAKRGETFGLAPLEAMAAGCVPIVSDLPCFKDFIHSEENGFIFDHRSPSSLTNLLKRICNSPQTLQILSKKAHESTANFQAEKIASQFLEDFTILTS